jgi:hypothetical protein
LLKLNLGCGAKKLEGFVNVDKYPTTATDTVFDLETTPWPWPSGSVGEAHFIHSLEHLGRDTDVFLAIMKELYRVCADGAAIVIHVPHPRSDDFLGDPTHVRPITPQMLTLFDRQKNDEWTAGGISAATPLARYLEVDFRIADVQSLLTPAYYEKYKAGELTAADLDQKARDLNNVIAEYHIRLVARKR